MSTSRKLITYCASGIGLVRLAAMPLSFLDELGEELRERHTQRLKRFLRDGYLSEALYVASPSLHDRLMAWSEVPTPDRGLEDALTKYLMRMSSRSTPFGMFAMATSCLVGSRRTSLECPGRETWQRRVRIDSATTQILLENVAADTRRLDLITLTPNGTLFHKGNAIRFLAMDRLLSSRRRYRSMEAEKSEQLEAALDFAKGGIKLSALVSLLAEKFPSESNEELEAFVADLVDSQILGLDHLVHITSGDMFKGAMNALRATELAEPMQAADDLVTELSRRPLGEGLDVYRRLQIAMKTLGVSRPNGIVSQTDVYAVSDSSLAVSSQDAENIGAAAFAMLALGPTRRSPLATFCERFEGRYGDASVPLLEVLDPTLGIGFPDSTTARPALIRRALPSDRPPLDKVLSGPALIASLFEKSLDPSKLYIELDEALVKAAVGAVPPKMPSTVTAWATPWRSSDGTLHWELANTTTHQHGRLLGRFAEGLPELCQFLRAENDELGSDDVLVAEIVHLPQGALGNVTTRPCLSNWEIPIRCGTSPESSSISLNDITVSVRRGSVFLHSLSQGKMIVPQMSNAHRYTASGGLGIYSFLNEVAYQEVQRLPLSLRSLLPDWTFLPGLVYRGIIVSRPIWRFDKALALKISAQVENGNMEGIHLWASDHGLPRWLTLVRDDNVLIFDRTNSEMVRVICKEAARHATFELRDARPMEMMPAATSNGIEHVTEFLLPLSLSDDRSSIKATKAPTPASVKHIWSEWLQFNLYGHEDQHDLCLFVVGKVAEALRVGGKIRGYFFVRYTDPQGTHIRLRIRRSDSAVTTDITEGLFAALQELVSEGTISHVAQVPYLQEVDRYGGAVSMGLCEEIFCADSSACINTLSTWNRNSDEGYLTALASIDILLEQLGLSAIEDKLEFSSRAADSFSKEFYFGVSERKSIGALFRMLALGTLVPIDEMVASSVTRSFREIGRTVSTAWASIEAIAAPDSGRLYSLRWSILHMRMNRLLGKEHRLQEAILWELVRRYYLAKVMRKAPTDQVTRVVSQ